MATERRLVYVDQVNEVLDSIQSRTFSIEDPKIAGFIAGTIIACRILIGEIPTANAAEPVYASWENGFCTNCRNKAEIQSIGFGCAPGSARINYKHTKFCSGCGAIMDGDRNA